MQHFGGLRRDDRLLGCNEEPPLGAHLVTPRCGYAHHGIYVGGGRVVHYGGLGHRVLGGPVEEVSVRSFTRGHTLWLRSHDSCRFSSTEVMNRARSRVGEDCYRLFSNNCEHFCEWCVDGKHRSYQVERLLSRVESVIGPVITRLFTVPSLDTGVEGEPS